MERQAMYLSRTLNQAVKALTTSYLGRQLIKKIAFARVEVQRRLEKTAIQAQAQAQAQSQAHMQKIWPWLLKYGYA
jgi:hypothetical protein